MTLEPDREWDRLASAYRRYKPFMPLSNEEAERIAQEAPRVDISSEEVKRIVSATLSGLDLDPAPIRGPDEPVFVPNTRVRLKGDPTRVGMVTGNTRPGRRERGLRYQVTFPDMPSWVPADQLELVPAQRETPIDLLEQGKLGRAIDLRRTLTHFRLTGRLADVIYSMETTNTDFYAYQFKPVLRFLLSPSNALLIADEVGLGKTIEAGLIWTELRSRFDLRRLLVLCPAVLREKWKRELGQKIGVRAEIVDASDLLSVLRDPFQARQGFALICSLQGARPNRHWQDPDDVTAAAELARFLIDTRKNDESVADLLVIDEAHYLRNPESQTNELGQLFRPVVENLLLLSATPIHNRNHDLFTLLQLLDGDTFVRPEDLSSILEASRPLVEAREEILRPHPNGKVLKLLEQAESHPLLRGNRQLALAREQATDSTRFTDPAERARFARRLELINPLAYVITRTRKRDVKEWRVVREPVAEDVPMSRCEEAFYSEVTSFIIDYAMKRAVNERFILATPQRQMSSSMAASLQAWMKRGDNVDDFAAANRDAFTASDDIGPLTREIIDRASSFGDADELRANDSKYVRVRGMLNQYFRANPDEKVVLFSTFRETLNYLGQRLAEDGISNVVMHGGIRTPKERILAAFQDDPGIRVLLSSEVGSEGIDLQFCRVLINYDLPWNPMRVEQRIGRLDRLGQNAKKILVWNLFYKDTIDSRIYERLYEKLDLCRQALGDFEAVLGEEMRQLTTALLSDHLSAGQQERRIDQTAQALANMRHEQEELENDASHLVAYGDYILNQIQAARELNRWINGDDLRTYVTDFFRLQYPGCSFKRRDRESSLEYEVRLSPAAKQDLESFIRSNRLATSTRLTQGGAETVVCRFESRVTGGERVGAEIVSQFHPIVRFVSNAIQEREEQLSPAVAVRLERHVLSQSAFRPGLYLLGAARWSVEGLQASEKLTFAAIQLKDERGELEGIQAEQLASACAAHGSDWPEGRIAFDLREAAAIADENIFGRLEEQFQEFVEEIRRQNEDRADLQMRNLDRHLVNQRRKLADVRERHRALGRESLVKATEGQIHSLENRVERRRMNIEKGRAIRYRSDEVLVALVQIE